MPQMSCKICMDMPNVKPVPRGMPQSNNYGYATCQTTSGMQHVKQLGVCNISNN